MKGFLRTIGGKITLVALFLIMAYAALAALFGVFFCINRGLYDEDTEDYASYDYYRDFAIEAAIFALSDDKCGMADKYAHISFKVTDSKGNVLVQDGPKGYDLDQTITVYAQTDPIMGVSCGIYQEDEHEPYEVTFSIDSAEGLSLSQVKEKKLADRFKYALIAAVAGCTLIGLAIYIMILCVSARRPGSEEVHPGYFHFIPTDIMLIPLVMNLCLFGAGNEAAYAAVFILPFTGVLLSMSIAARIKDKSLVKNTVIYRILMLIWKFITIIPSIWKVLLLIAFECVSDLLICALNNGEERFTVFVISKLMVIPLVIYFVYMLTRLKDGARKLASGDFDHRVNTKYMVGDIKNSAEDMNSIAKGMDLALQEKMKSERLKTELITNVSHDIKTPLTSIINYTDLISKEKTDNSKIAEYTEVLTRQSDKLKRLIEDLVEASKASTGNIEVELVPCEAGIFLTQCAGEFEDRFNSCELTQVVSVPDKEIKINADGRRMLRVFDNLMSNICKYSQPGTRVYMTLKEEGNEAVFEFKNTSKDALNMTEEELMERFTRGDKSRNTEGNGLGLAIARSLTELQGGRLNIDIDGDLFKAYVRFPKL